ncbi:hypothetical protein Tco_0262584 [Tanacetum coccineum]
MLLVPKTVPPMLNKDNYVPWSSRLLCYAKSKPNGKLIYNSIMNGPYVRRMIPEPGDSDCEVPVAESFHEQTDDELTEKENPGGQNVRNQNGLIVVPGIANQNVNQNGNEFDLMAVVWDLDEIKEVNTNYILMANLQQASTSGTQTDNAPIYDSDGSAEVVQICLWCIDSGCSKHMTGNLKLLINFVWKFLGTVHFGNDHIAAILGYGYL